MSDLHYRPLHQPLVPPGEIECFARDMTATISADTTLAAVQTRLAEHNQWLPIDGDPSQSIGQLVEYNSTGPLRLGYGAWRDLLLGCQFINGKNELITAGGRTVKNVAGYDLTKFMVGQRGVFGRIQTITTRTYRLPAAALLARFESAALSGTGSLPVQPEHGQAARATEFLNSLLPTDLRPHWAVLNSEHLYLAYLSDQRTIDYYERVLHRHNPAEIVRRSLADDITHRQTLWASAPLRVALPPGRIGQFIELSRARNWAADPVFGIVHVFENLDPERLRSAVQATSARLWPETSGQPIPNVYNPGERQILLKLKEAFDPGHTLNPLVLD